jgi:hypothetical protein
MAASVYYSTKPTADKLHLISRGTKFLYSSHPVEFIVVNGNM